MLLIGDGAYEGLHFVVDSGATLRILSRSSRFQRLKVSQSVFLGHGSAKILLYRKDELAKLSRRSAWHVSLPHVLVTKPGECRSREILSFVVRVNAGHVRGVEFCRSTETCSREMFMIAALWLPEDLITHCETFCTNTKNRENYYYNQVHATAVSLPSHPHLAGLRCASIKSNVLIAARVLGSGAPARAVL